MKKFKKGDVVTVLSECECPEHDQYGQKFTVIEAYQKEESTRLFSDETETVNKYALNNDEVYDEEALVKWSHAHAFISRRFKELEGALVDNAMSTAEAFKDASKDNPLIVQGHSFFDNNNPFLNDGIMTNKDIKQKRWYAPLFN